MNNFRIILFLAFFMVNCKPNIKEVSENIENSINNNTGLMKQVLANNFDNLDTGFILGNNYLIFSLGTRDYNGYEVTGMVYPEVDLRIEKRIRDNLPNQALNLYHFRINYKGASTMTPAKSHLDFKEDFMHHTDLDFRFTGYFSKSKFNAIRDSLNSIFIKFENMESDFFDCSKLIISNSKGQIINIKADGDLRKMVLQLFKISSETLKPINLLESEINTLVGNVLKEELDKN